MVVPFLGRRDAERKQFTALMRKVEAVRVHCGLTKTELAAKLDDALRNSMTGRAIGRKDNLRTLGTSAEIPERLTAA